MLPSRATILSHSAFFDAGAKYRTSVGRDHTACVDAEHIERFKIESLTNKLDSLFKEKHRRWKAKKHADPA